MARSTEGEVGAADAQEDHRHRGDGEQDDLLGTPPVGIDPGHLRGGQVALLRGILSGWRREAPGTGRRRESFIVRAEGRTLITDLPVTTRGAASGGSRSRAGHGHRHRTRPGTGGVGHTTERGAKAEGPRLLFLVVDLLEVVGGEEDLGRFGLELFALAPTGVLHRVEGRRADHRRFALQLVVVEDVVVVDQIVRLQLVGRGAGRRHASRRSLRRASGGGRASEGLGPALAAQDRGAPDVGVGVEPLLLLVQLGGEGGGHPRRQLAAREGRPLGDHELLERLVELAGRLPAVRRLPGQGPHQDVVELLRDAGHHLRGRSHLGVADLLQGGEVALAGEEPVGRQHLVHAGADGEDVRAVVDGEPTHLLRAHVAELALEHAGLSLGRPRRRLRDAEVDQLHRALVAHEDVLRGDVPVDQVQRLTTPVPLGVRVLERLTHPPGDVRDHRRRHALPHLAKAIHDLEQILTPDVLHRDVVGVPDLPELVDRDDARVVQVAGDLGLIDEHLDEVLVLRHGREDSLDRDDLLEALDAEGLRQEDLGHPSDRDAIEKQVLSERDDPLPRRWLRPRAPSGVLRPHVLTMPVQFRQINVHPPLRVRFVGGPPTPSPGPLGASGGWGPRSANPSCFGRPRPSPDEGSGTERKEAATRTSRPPLRSVWAQGAVLTLASTPRKVIPTETFWQMPSASGTRSATGSSTPRMVSGGRLGSIS